jgi:hypothetical protein
MLITALWFSPHVVQCRSPHCTILLHCSVDHRTVSISWTVVLITTLYPWSQALQCLSPHCTVHFTVVMELFVILHYGYDHRTVLFNCILVLITALYRSSHALYCWLPYCIVLLHCNVDHLILSFNALLCSSPHCTVIHTHLSVDHRTRSVILITAGYLSLAL